MTWIDLSQPFFEGMPQSRLMDPVSLSPTEVASPHEEDGRVRITAFRTATHIGTHVDAPLHFHRNGPAIDAIALDRLAGPAVVLDVPREDMVAITVEDLENAGPTPEAGDIVLVKTGWGEYFSEEQVKRYVKYPYLAAEVADWLVGKRVKMLGMDTLAPDPPHKLRPPGYQMDLHVKLFQNDILIMENLNLASVESGRYEVFAFPLALAGADGAPARVVARRAAA